MANSETGNFLNRGSPIISVCDLPAEMLLSIFSHSKLVSLIRLSATCRSLRYLVHDIFTSRIKDQANKYPEVKESLDRLGWKKKHDFSDCKCFKMMVGPGFTWSQLEQQQSFSAVCQPILSRTSTTTAGKTFFVTEKDITYAQTAPGGDSEDNSLRILISFDDVVFGVALASYDNALAAILLKLAPNPMVTYYVFNANSLVKVSQTNLDYIEDGVTAGNRNIALTCDTMVVYLDYYIQGEIETKIHIWKINTRDPQEEGNVLLYTMSHNTAPLSKLIRCSYITKNFCVNDRFVVIFDVVVKVFRRNQENPLACQIETENRTLKKIALQGRDGDHLAVALVSLNAVNVPKLTVNVYSASRGGLIVQREIDPFPRWSSTPFYMKWFGDHLIIGLQQGSVVAFFSWQPGLSSFLSSPCLAPVVRRSPRGVGGDTTVWTANCLHIDFQGIIVAVSDNHESFGKRYFNTLKSSS